MNFYFVQLLVFIELFNIVATFSSSTALIQQTTEDALKELAEPGISSCYTYYSKVMKELTKTLESDLKECQRVENDKYLILSHQEDVARATTTETLNEVCEIFEECKAKSESLDFFDCVESSEEKNAYAVWKASRDSSETAGYVRLRRAVIKHEGEMCKNEAERVYGVGFMKATNDLIACSAQGGLLLPTHVSGNNSGARSDRK